MSVPWNTTWPLVGSISRVRHRTSVDFPEPDRPITTNTSPQPTSKLTSRTATAHPVFFLMSWTLSLSMLVVAGDVGSLGAEDLPQSFDTEFRVAAAQGWAARPPPWVHSLCGWPPESPN